MFTQDDAHLFCRPNQIEEEIIKVLDLILLILKSFGFNEYKVYLSTRPDKFVGSEENWEKSDQCTQTGFGKIKLEVMKIDPGEGVFYGPKIDIKIKDSLNRFWQVFNRSSRL